MNELYPTWYAFKKDLQKEFGYPVLNQEWLFVKPREPLPWNNSCLQASLSKLSQLDKANLEIYSLPTPHINNINPIVL
jgi:hypothetical protein